MVASSTNTEVISATQYIIKPEQEEGAHPTPMIVSEFDSMSMANESGTSKRRSKSQDSVPKRGKFSAFMKKAIIIFIEELEKDPDLKPENFIITRTARKDVSDKKRK